VTTRDSGVGVAGLERFGSEFVWGVATAAYQIEGGAAEGGRGTAIWDTFAHTPGRTRHGDNGDVACDHYHRWASDLDLLVELGIPAYRLSLSWSRLQPAGRGPLNPEGVDFYRALLEGLRERGITPFVTLYHWDLPQPLEDAGGWTNRKTAHLFADYCAQVVRSLGALAEHWITLNEPWCSSFLGYGYGQHAPGKADMRAAVAAAHHLSLAHGLATAEIRVVAPHAKIGITNIITDIHPASDDAEDLSAAVRLDASSNRVFLDPIYLGHYSEAVLEVLDPYGLQDHIQDGDLTTISVRQDFAGINHYHRVVASHDGSVEHFQVSSAQAQPATTAFGWSVIPDSLAQVLLRVSREYTALPIYVTESGASFHDYVDPDGEVVDLERVDYLRGYLDAVGTARSSGVDVAGYFAWSFLDNFEWAEGYSQRFGLVFVDFGTQRRIPKLSARWYSAHIASYLSTSAHPAVDAAPHAAPATPATPRPHKRSGDIAAEPI
jgi:beta-glucosidase